ncbi:MAG: TonB-dependent receptor [Acidobacteria bacterium]|nr:TonB-dependent receptor [Acidobacteriota bacterium]
MSTATPPRNGAILAVALCLPFSVAVQAQVTTGTLNVAVQDPSGVGIEGATIRIRHVASGQERSGATGSAGTFRAAFMPVGEYSVRVESSGFKSKTIAGIVLQVDQNTTLPVTLEIGSVQEVVEISAATPLLESNTSSIGQVIDNKRIVDLPLSGRNPFALGLLAGNTVPVFGLGTNLPFVGGGGRASSNEIMIDGLENNTTQNGNNIGRTGAAYVPSVDAVQEFKVLTNNFSAEFGSSAGMVMNVTMKSGSNEIHGGVFEFVRNDKFDANNFFSNKAGRRRAAFRQNQFGGTIGGPIVKNRLFYFGSYEGTIQRTAASSSISDLPPQSYRTGNFASYRETIFDPKARVLGPAGTVISTPFPGNVIPSSQLNRTATAIMNEVPAPNFGAANAESQNYFLQVPRGFEVRKWDVKSDYVFSPRNTLFGRYSRSDQSTPNPGRFGPDHPLGAGSVQILDSRQLVLNDTHVFGPAVVNEFRFGYTHYDGSVIGLKAKEGAELAKRVGLALFELPFETFTGLTFPFSGGAQGASQFSGIGGGGNSTPSFEDRFQWSDNLNIIRGNHTLKMGTDFRRLRIDVLRAGGGSFVFGSTFTASGAVSGSGAPFADFMLGFPTGISAANNMLQFGRAREVYSGSYFQDDWKVSRRLSLNLGIRYDLFSQPVEASDLGSMFNPRTGVFVRPNEDGFSRALVKGDHNNIAPRVGFSYQVTPKLVVRGGYGAFFGMRERNTETTQFSMNPPNTALFGAPIVTPRTLAPPFTINDPIRAQASDHRLSGFTAQRPFQSNFRFSNFDNSNMPVLHQSNVSIQYEPVSNWLLAMTVTKAVGRDLASGWFNRNSLPFQAALDGRNRQADRPFPHVNGWTIESGSWGASDYSSVSFKLERRFAKGFTVLANYTVAKNIESLGSGVCNFSQYTTTIVLDNYSPQREKTVAPLDVPQVLNFSYLYELPWGVGKQWLSKGILARVLGNWQVNGITTLRSGFPGEVLTNVQPPVFSNFNVPDRVSGVNMYLGHGPDGYLNPAAFRVPGTALGASGTPVQMYGNSARGMVRGPGSVNSDFSVFKELAVSERLRAQFRFEFFNLTNTPTFFLGAPSSSPMTCRGVSGAPCGNTDFGTLNSGTATGRQIQFGAKLRF